MRPEDIELTEAVTGERIMPPEPSEPADTEQPERELLIDLLVMSPMSDTVGVSLTPISCTADEILSSEWLRRHDAAVAAKAKAEALEEAATDIVQDDSGADEWYAKWLTDRANRIRREAGGES